jgi:dienelactone hydrolase
MVSRIVLAWLLAARGLVGGLPAAAGQGSVPVATLADGRVGQIHFESRTPAGYFALARREAASGAVVVGTLRLPKDAIGRVPAMVIAHGSGGVDAREAAWADRLCALGLATFVVDSFTPRNIRETALEPFRRGVLDDDRRFVAHVALYPYCSDWYTAARVTGAPLLLLLGGRDDCTPAEACRGCAEWFKGAGAATTVGTYPNAYHDFDSERLPRFERGLVTGRGRHMAVDLDHFTVARRGTGEDITATAGR